MPDDRYTYYRCETSAPRFTRISSDGVEEQYFYGAGWQTKDEKRGEAWCMHTKVHVPVDMLPPVLLEIANGGAP